MIVHLKMTGHLLIKNKKLSLKEKQFFDERVNQYIRHFWVLKKGTKELRMEFSDLRKFGKIRLLKGDDLENDKELERLGIEPLSSDFDLERLNKILDKKKNSNLRNVLMDQSLISGIGNIYASEILFRAKISPLRKAGKLSGNERKNLYLAIRKILQKAIQERGTSDSDYRDTSGVSGGFQKFLKVYNREKKPCLRKGCQGVIKRKKINQRSAFWCPQCQK